MVTVTFIGAGSMVFAKKLIGDILSFDELSDSEIVLMDIDEHRLEQTRRVADAMVENEGLDATVSATLDRREALDGADYVLNMINVGGTEPFENEIRIPEAYGVKQAIGDTTGPGGIFRALRTIPTMLDLAADMEELCPDALLMNYTNPMSMLCKTVFDATDVDVVGLCHSVPHTAEAIAEYVGVPQSELEYWVAGINHMAWFLECEHEGESVYPALHEAYHDEETYRKDTVRFEMMKHFGAFPTESSHHMSEYLPYVRTDEAQIEAMRGTDYAERMPTGTYLDSLETDTQRRFNLNVSNETNAIENLPADACVEVPVFADGSGLHPASVGELPTQLAALDRQHSAVYELAVEGALEGNREKIHQAVKLDPLSAAACSLDEIHRMTEELIEANAEYLPALEWPGEEPHWQPLPADD